MNFKKLGKRFFWLCLALMLTLGCAQTAPGGAQPAHTAQPLPTPTRPADLPSPSPSPTPSLQALNPLSGLQVADPSLLELPPVLVSISTFPVTARPQAGLSFAPFVFEIYITEGTTRYLTAFYGEFPAPEAPLSGSCPVRREPFQQSGLLLGNRVWLDANQNHLQDDWERGIGGVCVNLYDAERNLLQQTSTDSNGYYGFNVDAGTYFLAFEKPAGLEFAAKDAGDETKDSDVDPASGWSDALEVSASLLDVDLGLILPHEPPPSPDLPPARVGPVRSGRLVYADIAAFFEGSCLIYAYASAEVLVELPRCAFVDHNIQGGGYMLDIATMRELAEERRDPQAAAKYAVNLFDPQPPAGGSPATRLDVFIAWLNQSGWVYDPLSQSYWRYVDDGKETTAGILHPEVERLTGRQLQFENIILLFTRHDVISPTNLDIHLEHGLSGKALLFRDGQVYNIQWNTEDAGPIKFQIEDNHPFPLKPGRTWVTVVTPETIVTERKPGEWYLRFSQPPGAK